MSTSRKALSDEQYLAIDELRLLEYDVQLRMKNMIRESGQPIRYNTRALETAQERFKEAFMWAISGIANEGPTHNIPNV